jgi:hypothetical protein
LEIDERGKECVQLVRLPAGGLFEPATHLVAEALVVAGGAGVAPDLEAGRQQTIQEELEKRRVRLLFRKVAAGTNDHDGVRVLHGDTDLRSGLRLVGSRERELRHS